MSRWLRAAKSEEHGSVMVLIAVAMTALLAIGAISVDAGKLYVERQHLANVADAAALAGAQFLPDNTNLAIETALEYVELNGVPREQATAAIADASNQKIRVTIEQNVPLTFARVIQIDEKSVMAGANAIRGPIGRVRGVIPIGVDLADGIQFGETVMLKEGGGYGSHGNFGGLALGGRGACVYRENLREGYDDWLEVGQVIDSEPGNMAGPTRQGLQDRIDADPYATVSNCSPDSPRLLLLPIVDFTGAHGRSEVTIEGFACFFLDDITCNGDVTGQFVRTVKPGEVIESASADDYGVDVVKLTR